ncbi:hypothetical protein WJX84_005727 [Apatococcus fuscideae]|uniref:Uncharacterized protein n=1 Tax=Apatococcus fuscideae TaxID=2026836 RepID=A0AAW1SMZ2_9CHLO
MAIYCMYGIGSPVERSYRYLHMKTSKGWHGKQLNPHGVRIASREYVHEPTTAFNDYRGGPKASTHVEILSNALLIADVLKIAAGEVLGDSITSNINEIAAKIDLQADLRPEDKTPACDTGSTAEAPPRYPQHRMR